MAKQTITNYDVENYPQIADECEVGDVIDTKEYNQLVEEGADVNVEVIEERGEELDISAEDMDAEYTKDELKEECADEGLKVSGSKDDLIDRLLNQ